MTSVSCARKFHLQTSHQKKSKTESLLSISVIFTFSIGCVLIDGAVVNWLDSFQTNKAHKD
jgi:hypothetical protein